MFMDVFGCLWMFMVDISTSLFFFPNAQHFTHHLFGHGTMLKFLQEMLTSLGDPMQEHEAKDLISQLPLRLTLYIYILYIIILLAVFSPILYQLYHLDRCVLTLLGCLDVDSHSKKTPSFTARWRRY